MKNKEFFLIPKWISHVASGIYVILILLGVAIAGLYDFGVLTITDNGNIAGLSRGLAVAAFG